MRHFAGSKSLQLPGIVGLNGPKSLSLRELYLENFYNWYPGFLSPAQGYYFAN